ncbi:hypothetical protein INR49_004173, partial [Caranx melampygus]
SILTLPAPPLVSGGGVYLCCGSELLNETCLDLLSDITCDASLELESPGALQGKQATPPQVLAPRTGGVYRLCPGCLRTKLDLGTRLTEIRRPVFLLSGKLVQSLGLKQNRPLAAATHLPVVQLNFAAVAQESPFSRDVVEGCVRETLLILVRALASNQHVSVTFQGVGVLFFKNNKVVRMKFNSDFMNAVDGSGRLLLALRNRPGSSVSLLSGGLSRTQRPESIRDITLPTVCSPQLDHRAADREGRRLSSAPEEITAGGKQDRTGEDRRGQERTEQNKTGQDRTEVQK